MTQWPRQQIETAEEALEYARTRAHELRCERNQYKADADRYHAALKRIYDESSDNRLAAIAGDALFGTVVVPSTEEK